ncbi:MAG TPA: DUF6786 family protein [Chitinophagaceae bacterium]|nr:DUF6786 family protein [Chitinophagaceae bacterium]
MKYFNSYAALFLLLCTAMACNQPSSTEKSSLADTSFSQGSYAYDAAFLKKNTNKVLQLVNGQSKVLLSADYEGRVMTSTALGDSGTSYGWLNYNLIGSGKKVAHFNAFGGEERFWLGPEGGQYSLYFKKGDSFTVTNWQVPPLVDTEPYDIVSADSTQAIFTKNATITNYSGTNFTLNITRKIQLLDKAEVENKLQTTIPSGIDFVAFETDNQLKNTGSNDWKKSTGLLSIWLLGQFTPTAETKVIIPFSGQKDAHNFITDNYFGKIPADRLLVKDSVLYFRCDGKSRGKLGLSPQIAKPIAGSYDFQKNILTILIPQVDKKGDYVNSKWEMQKQPYKGDVINSYNDGPMADGTQLGPFYEIESSSAVKELKPGEVQEYSQATCHFQGDYASLKALAKQLLGVDLDEVKKW